MTGVNFYLSDLIFPSCAVFCTSQKVLDDRKSVIKPENFCLRLIRLKKCRAMGDIRWKKCNKVELFA